MVFFQNNITASGNISSSGTGEFTYVDLSADQVRLSTERALVRISSNVFGTGENGSGKWIARFISASSFVDTLQITSSMGELNVAVPLTSSNDISASGASTTLTVANIVTSNLTTDDIVVSNAVTASLTGSQATIGNINLGAPTSLDGTITLNTGSQGSTAVGFASGQIVKFGGGNSLVAGQIVVLQSNGKWTAAANTNTAASTGSLGVALGSSAATDGVLLNGITKVPQLINGASGDIGDPVYLDGGGRAGITPASSTGNVIRIIGHLLSGSGDSAPAIIHFTPSPDFIIHA